MLPASNLTTSAHSFNPADYPGFTPDPGVDYRPIPDDDGRYTGVPGTPLDGYLVGDDGSVWTCRDNHGQITTRWKKSKQSDNGNGYLFVPLCVRRIVKRWRVNRLVLTAFVGPCPPGMEACHEDDDRKNNRLSNLKWDTKKNNIRQRNDRGRLARGERTGNSKLKEADIPKIRAMHAAGLSHRKIAKVFNVSREPIRLILAGLTWTHVKSADAEEVIVNDGCPCGESPT